jgi:hypothetical protein
MTVDLRLRRLVVAAKRRHSAIVILLVCLGSAIFPLTVVGQEVVARERIEARWILRYEQAYGVEGLYVEEPPPSPSDRDALIRQDLVSLTLAGLRFKEQYPNEQPNPSLLFIRDLIDRKIVPPQGIEYQWSESTSRFVANPPGDGAGDMVMGAMAQIEAAEAYRRTVAMGSADLNRNWQVFVNDPQSPELIRREIETRRYAARQTQTEVIHQARRTQALLKELNDSIELAMVSGALRSGQEITMQDVGRTGLIDLLERLPLDGEYIVTRAGEPPKAKIRGKEVPYAPSSITTALRTQAEEALAANPEYPPALAVLSRYVDEDEGIKLISRAIELWPDVPALRIQRIAMNASRDRYDELRDDLDMIVERFPAAPLLLEIDMATYRPEKPEANAFRAALMGPLAEIRPELLNIQILAMKAFADSGDAKQASVVRQRVLDRHPGYEPLLVVEGSD